LPATLSQCRLYPTNNLLPKSATEKLTALSWESTAPAEAVATTARAHCEHGRNGVENGPDRETEASIIEAARGGR